MILLSQDGEGDALPSWHVFNHFQFLYEKAKDGPPVSQMGYSLLAADSLLGRHSSCRETHVSDVIFQYFTNTFSVHLMSCVSARTGLEELRETTCAQDAGTRNPTHLVLKHNIIASL